MNLRAVGRLLGIVLLLMAGFLLVPVLVAIIAKEERAGWAFFLSAVVSAVTGFGLAWTNKGSVYSKEGRPDYFRREGLAVVGLSTALLVGGAVSVYVVVPSLTVISNVMVEFARPSGAVNVGCAALASLSVIEVPLVCTHV